MVKHPKSGAIVEDVNGKRAFVNSINLEDYLESSANNSHEPYQPEITEANPNSPQFNLSNSKDSSSNMETNVENELMSGGSDSGNIIIVKKE